MKKLVLVIALTLFFGISISYSQNKYSRDQVVSPNDTITYSKIDMKPLNGIIHCEFGDMGRFVNGRKEGLHFRWHDSGQLEQKVDYKEGKETGLAKGWHDNGQLFGEGHYKDGKQDGAWQNWWDNGQLSHKGNWKDGKEDGLFRVWYPNGRMMIEVMFKDGVEGERKEWNEQGVQIKPEKENTKYEPIINTLKL